MIKLEKQRRANEKHEMQVKNQENEERIQREKGEREEEEA
jgi:hypothetical protein